MAWLSRPALSHTGKLSPIGWWAWSGNNLDVGGLSLIRCCRALIRWAGASRIIHTITIIQEGLWMNMIGMDNDAKCRSRTEFFWMRE
uniref:Uncharacterized protein n=1 Tax=Oryza glumipatula TaxID=40148 RepID=A0A0D9YR52_9ORYZ